MIPHI